MIRDEKGKSQKGILTTYVKIQIYFGYYIYLFDLNN